jgi:septum formation protein
MLEVILASASPARLAILRQIGMNPRVIISHAREATTHHLGAKGLVELNAIVKAATIAQKMKSGIVIGADTVVEANGKILGKPKSKADAIKTLALLSSVPQIVYSGACVIDVYTKRIVTVSDTTKVFMRPLSREQIVSYVNSVDVHKLAGSFDIQGKGARFIERIEGCYNNVVGLPLAKLMPVFEEFEI